MPPTAKHGTRRRTASQLVASGEATRRQVYAAALALARLQDRGVGLSFTLEDMCEVLGYVGAGRRPTHVPARQLRRPRVA